MAWKIFMIIFCVIANGVLGFILGLRAGGDLEKHRYEQLYPRIGRLRIEDDTKFKLDFGVDPSTIKDYKGALLDIQLTKSVDYDSQLKGKSDEELYELTKEALDCRDALKT